MEINVNIGGGYTIDVSENFTKGKDGKDGKSAYEIWKELGNEGDEQQFINSLKGDPGEKGEPGTTTWAGITDKPDVYTKAESDRKYARITIVTWED